MIVENKLQAMGLELPAVADPAGLYVYTRRVGNLVYRTSTASCNTKASSARQ